MPTIYISLISFYMQPYVELNCWNLKPSAQYLSYSLLTLPSFSMQIIKNSYYHLNLPPSGPRSVGWLWAVVEIEIQNQQTLLSFCQLGTVQYDS